MFLFRSEYDYLLDTNKELLRDCFDNSDERRWCVAGVELRGLEYKCWLRLRAALGQTSDS